MRRVIRLLLPPVVVGVLVALAGALIAHGDYNDPTRTADQGSIGETVFVVGLGLIAFGLVAVAVYGAVRFVRWAIR